VQVNGKPGAIVNVMPQVSVQGEPLASRAVQDILLRDTIVYLTCVHELGHAVGMPHTRKFEDIMYFFGYGGDIVDYFMRYRSKLLSRADIAKYSGLSRSDIEVLRTLYRN
jgi:predicted Zn-dependent protease